MLQLTTIINCVLGQHYSVGQTIALLGIRWNISVIGLNVLGAHGLNVHNRMSWFVGLRLIKGRGRAVQYVVYMLYA